MHVILNNCCDVSTVERTYCSEACSGTVYEVYVTGWLAMSVCCAESAKGPWGESRFCTEYKKTIVFIEKIMLSYVA